MDYSAVIFDMDGVIVDSEPVHEQAFRQIFEEMGYGDNHGIDFAAYYGRSDRALWIDFVALHHPKQTLEELVAWKQRLFIELITAKKPVFDGAARLIERLHPLHPIGLASGSAHPVIDSILTLRNLRRYFKAVVSVQDVPHGKPAPDVFLRAAELMGVRPKDTVIVEDAPAGVEAGLAGGFKVIAITNSVSAKQLSRAHLVVKDYSEIEQALGF